MENCALNTLLFCSMKSKCTNAYKTSHFLSELLCIAEASETELLRGAAWEWKSLIMCFIKSVYRWGNDIYTVWLIQCIPVSKETSNTLLKNTKGVWDRQTDRQTCTDGHRIHKLLSPGMSADDQRQVSLLDQFINGALKHSNRSLATFRPQDSVHSDIINVAHIRHNKLVFKLAWRLQKLHHASCHSSG